MVSIFDSFQPKFEKVVQHLTDDLKTVKTGRAKPSLVEDIVIEAYSTKMKLKELASITAPEPHQIILSPWDKTLVEAIAKAINTTQLNLNAIVDGDVVRINIPPLTEETRNELAKLVGQKVESAKVMLRQVRIEAKKAIEEQKDEGGIGEDEIRRQLENLQSKIEEYEERLKKLGEAKEEELKSI